MSIESFVEFGKATEKVATALGDLSQALDVVSQTPCFTTPLWKENPSVMISINPKWCELIASGRKTIEVRRTRPKIEQPFKCYIYQTKHREHNGHTYSDGKVIGEFICDCILSHCEMANADIAEQQGCIKREKLFEYSNGKELFGWHISDLVIYDKPKKLKDFFVYCERCDKRPVACEYLYEESNESIGYYSECMCDFKRPIKRPFQSWGYAENYTEDT